MADLFGDYKRKSSKSKENSFDSAVAYEEVYMKLLKKYQPEIHDIEEMMESVRKEREDFYLIKLPAIKQAMNKDEVEPSIQQEWLAEIQKNTEKSFEISESLIRHYITKNLDEFKHELSELRNKV